MSDTATPPAEQAAPQTTAQPPTTSPSPPAAAPPALAATPAETTKAPEPPLPPSAASTLRLLLDKEKALQEERRSLDARAAKVEALSRAIDDPQEYMRLSGKTPADMRKALEAQETSSAVYERAIAALHAEVQALKQREEESRREATAREVREGVKRWVKHNTSQEQHPLLTSLEDADDVIMEHLERHYQRTGEILSEAQAAEAIEKRLSGMLDRFSGLEPVKKRFAPTPGNQLPAPSPTPNQNLVSGSEPIDYDKLTMEQRLELAASMLKFESYDPNKT